MRSVFLIVALQFIGGLSCGAQEIPQKPSQDEVAHRTDKVMDLAAGATTHHFRLLKDGGEIIVTANDPKDKATINQIRLHLSQMVGMFSNGNFTAPMLVHDTTPPGILTMTRLKSDIRYTVSDVDRGAQIRIAAASPETTDAVHAFLLFQIIDHKTGDSPAITDH